VFSFVSSVPLGLLTGTILSGGPQAARVALEPGGVAVTPPHSGRPYPLKPDEYEPGPSWQARSMAWNCGEFGSIPPVSGGKKIPPF
jgi:hypothetical protein